jgi:hypothetical protein
MEDVAAAGRNRPPPFQLSSPPRRVSRGTFLSQEQQEEDEFDVLRDEEEVATFQREVQAALALGLGGSYTPSALSGVSLGLGELEYGPGEDIWGADLDLPSLPSPLGGYGGLNRAPAGAMHGSADIARLEQEMNLLENANAALFQALARPVMSPQRFERGGQAWEASAPKLHDRVLQLQAQREEQTLLIESQMKQLRAEVEELQRRKEDLAQRAGLRRDEKIQRHKEKDRERYKLLKEKEAEVIRLRKDKGALKKELDMAKRNARRDLTLLRWRAIVDGVARQDQMRGIQISPKAESGKERLEQTARTSIACDQMQTQALVGDSVSNQRGDSLRTLARAYFRCSSQRKMCAWTRWTGLVAAGRLTSTRRLASLKLLAALIKRMRRRALLTGVEAFRSSLRRFEMRRRGARLTYLILARKRKDRLRESITSWSRVARTVKARRMEAARRIVLLLSRNSRGGTAAAFFQWKAESFRVESDLWCEMAVSHRQQFAATKMCRLLISSTNSSLSSAFRVWSRAASVQRSEHIAWKASQHAQIALHAGLSCLNRMVLRRQRTDVQSAFRIWQRVAIVMDRAEATQMADNAHHRSRIALRVGLSSLRRLIQRWRRTRVLLAFRAWYHFSIVLGRAGDMGEAETRSCVALRCAGLTLLRRLVLRRQQARMLSSFRAWHRMTMVEGSADVHELIREAENITGAALRAGLLSLCRLLQRRQRGTIEIAFRSWHRMIVLAGKAVVYQEAEKCAKTAVQAGISSLARAVLRMKRKRTHFAFRVWHHYAIVLGRALEVGEVEARSHVALRVAGLTLLRRLVLRRQYARILASYRTWHRITMVAGSADAKEHSTMQAALSSLARIITSANAIERVRRCAMKIAFRAWASAARSRTMALKALPLKRVIQRRLQKSLFKWRDATRDMAAKESRALEGYFYLSQVISRAASRAECRAMQSAWAALRLHACSANTKKDATLNATLLQARSLTGARLIRALILGQWRRRVWRYFHRWVAAARRVGHVEARCMELHYFAARTLFRVEGRRCCRDLRVAFQTWRSHITDVCKASTEGLDAGRGVSFKRLKDLSLRHCVGLLRVRTRGALRIAFMKWRTATQVLSTLPVAEQAFQTEADLIKKSFSARMFAGLLRLRSRRALSGAFVKWRTASQLLSSLPAAELALQNESDRMNKSMAVRICAGLLRVRSRGALSCAFVRWHTAAQLLSSLSGADRALQTESDIMNKNLAVHICAGFLRVRTRGALSVAFLKWRTGAQLLSSSSMTEQALQTESDLIKTKMNFAARICAGLLSVRTRGALSGAFVKWYTAARLLSSLPVAERLHQPENELKMKGFATHLCVGLVRGLARADLSDAFAKWRTAAQLLSSVPVVEQVPQSGTEHEVAASPLSNGGQRIAARLCLVLLRKKVTSATRSAFVSWRTSIQRQDSGTASTRRDDDDSSFKSSLANASSRVLFLKRLQKLRMVVIGALRRQTYEWHVSPTARAIFVWRDVVRSQRESEALYFSSARRSSFPQNFSAMRKA